MSIPEKIGYQIGEVFIESGIPGVTYVEPEDANFLRLAIAQPLKRAIIVEGPPRIGKTVTIQKIVEQAATDVQHPLLHIQRFLNPSIQKDLQDIITLRDWHDGTVVIDNFHNLDRRQREELTHYLIEMIFDVNRKKRLIIIGIPRVHQQLMDNIPDHLVSEVYFYPFQKPNDSLIEKFIEKLIERGENALNVRFEHKDQIIQTAHGSFELAQRLCYNLCVLARVYETQEQTKIVPFQIEKAVDRLMLSLDYRFARALKFFISCGGTDDTTCWHFLEKLKMARDGSLSLSHLKANAPSRVYEIERFIRESWMDHFIENHPEAVNYLFFEKASQTLIINDPQLSFYLKHKDLPALAHETGKRQQRPQVFISYSHDDKDCMERLVKNLNQIQLRPLVKPWVDSDIKPGEDWKRKIEEALDVAKAAVLLVSAPFWSSDFITKYELPALLENAKVKGTKVLFVILSASLIDYETEAKRFQFVNTPNDPVRGPGKTEPDWDNTFTKVARILLEYFKDE
ncbi:MAG TPA: TIR domain-containing protein [Ktedonobacteraceae bacterium]|nr:TIR domain-containing protein [Ktedonobacteraceae bacterium]